MLHPILWFVLVAVVAATPVVAQHLPRTDEVVVTASRVPEVRTEVVVAVDVIGRDEIEASASQDVVEVLRRVPGVDIVRGGGIGQQASVFIRGTNPNHALVLIDGVRVAALGTGAYAWEHLPLAQIERIEIVRGPRAALWGADALGGVIQIFTRREVRPYADLQLGSHDTYGLDAGTGRRGARGSFGVHVGWLETRGQNSTRPGHFSFDPDRDGALLRNVMARGELELGSQHLEATFLHTDNAIEFDQGRSQTRQDVQAVTLSGELAPGWDHRLILGGSRDRLDTPDAFTTYRSRRRQADWLFTAAPGQHGQVSMGLAWLNEDGHQMDTIGDTAIYAQARHTQSVFARWHRRIQAQTLQVSGRYDDNSVYGSQSSFAVAWARELGAVARLSASWGQGFRAPTMNELYSPGWGGWYAGNPELAPEHADNLELALHLSPSPQGEVEVRLFRNDIDAMIDFSGAQAQARNIARARIDGAELAWHWQGDAWNLETSATWQDPRSRDTGEALLRRPPRKASFLLERRFESGLRLGLEGVAASHRPDYGGVRLGGYGLLALRTRIPLGAVWSVDARLENLLDRDYTVVDGYHTPGATALLTLRWQGD